MPRSKREYLRRYADQALNDLDRSIDKITQLRNEYIDGSPVTDDLKAIWKADITIEPEGPYVLYIKAWSTVLQTQLQCRDFIQSLRDNNI